MNFQLVWQTTRACFVNKMAGIMLFVYLVMLLIGLCVLWSLSPAKVASIVGILAGIPATFWWAFVSSRSLKILREADRLLLPAPLKAISASLALQAIVTILVPAIICALLGGNFIETLIILCALAAGGLLFMLLPRFLGISMSLVPSLLTSLGKRGFIPASGTNDYLLFISLLAVGMIILALWRFHQLRRFDGDMNTWLSPMALLPETANGWNASGWTKSDDGKPLNLGMNFEAAVAPANTDTPVLALRTYLGGPFMPLTTRGQVKQLFMLLFTYIALPAFMIYTTTQESNGDRTVYAALAVCWVSFVGLAITFSSMLLRLQMLYTKDNTELAELALVPGWNNAPQAQSLLLKVMVQHVGRTLLLPVFIALIAAGLIESESNAAYFILAAILLTSNLIAAGYGLNIISGRKRHAWFLGFVCLALFVFSMTQLMLSVRSKDYVLGANGFLSWAILVSIAIVYFFFSWRPFKDQQHPFLRN